MSNFSQTIRAESPECLRLSLGIHPAKAAPHPYRRAALSQQTIDHLVATLLQDMKRGLLDLPTLPDVAQRVRRLVEDEQTSVAQIAMFLSLDPARRSPGEFYDFQCSLYALRIVWVNTTSCPRIQYSKSLVQMCPTGPSRFLGQALANFLVCAW